MLQPKQSKQAKRVLLSTLAALVLHFVTLTAHAAEVAGIKIDDKTRLANTDLVLNGAGLRYAAAGLIKVYAVALYLPQKATTYETVSAQKGVKRVTIHFLRDVTSNDFSKGLLSSMRANYTVNEQQKFVDGFLYLGNVFANVPLAKKGDVINMDLLPGVGVLFSLNGRPIIEPFKNEQFWNVVMAVWLGKKPVEESLKPVLLGVTPSNDNTIKRDDLRF